jgi:hypothetical protein
MTNTKQQQWGWATITTYEKQFDLTHRILGECCWKKDTDYTIYENGQTCNDVYEVGDFGKKIVEYELKYPNIDIREKIQLSKLGNRQNYNKKGELYPSVLIIPFIDDGSFGNVFSKSIYIYPTNKPAESLVKPGMMTLMQYSQWLHKIRNKTWNIAEPIQQKNIDQIQDQQNTYQNVHRLGDLPNDETNEIDYLHIVSQVLQ